MGYVAVELVLTGVIGFLLGGDGWKLTCDLTCQTEVYSNTTSGTGFNHVRQGLKFAYLTQFLEGSRVYPDTWEPPGPVRLEWCRIEVSKGGA